MTMLEAVALQPAWIEIWVNVLLLGAFILPVTLIFWKQTRRAGIITPIVSAIGGFATMQLYGNVGYVKLLGLPHVIFWTPTIIFLFFVWRKPDLPKGPKIILSVVMTTILISLAFDYVDVAHYVLGERTPFEGTI